MPRLRWIALVALLSALALPRVNGAQPGVSRAPALLADLPATKAVTCSACHGAGGNSRSDAMPILAGMDDGYFKKQIQDYARGARPSPEMEPYAKQTLNVGLDDVAAFFARQKMERTPIASDTAAAARGRAAAAECAVCHGPDGQGDRAKTIPGLAGQPPSYLRAQMLLFKQEQRNPRDSALKAMKALMKTIPDERLADLAAYYSSLSP